MSNKGETLILIQDNSKDWVRYKLEARIELVMAAAWTDQNIPQKAKQCLHGKTKISNKISIKLTFYKENFSTFSVLRNPTLHRFFCHILY